MDPKIPGVTDSSATPAPEPQVQQPEPAAQPAPAPAAAPTQDGGVTSGGKVYTEAEVNSMMHARTKDYAEMRKQLDSYRQHGTLEELAAKLKPSPASGQPAEQGQPALDADEQKFVEFLKKVLPELKSLESLKGLDPEKIAFLNQLRDREVSSQQAYIQSAEQAINAHCDSLGQKTEAQKDMVREMISATILSTPELYKRFQEKDPNVVSDAIKLASATLGVPQAPAVGVQQAQAAAKAKAAQIKPPLPAGGLPAPLTKDRKLSDEERLEAAFQSVKPK